MNQFLKRTTTCAAAFGAMALLASAVSAHAADRDRGHDQGRRDDHRGGGYYAAPPPVFYAPPPAEYAAPPVVYGSPGISIGINIP
jgi:hypothetical protein